MEDLVELVAFINKNKVKQIEIVGASQPSGSKVQELYDQIAAGRFKSEEEAIDYFYPDLSGNQRRKYFSNLKGRLRRRLINTLFMVGVQEPMYKDTLGAYNNVSKNLAAIRFLQSRNIQQAAISLAKKNLKVALKYEFVDFALALARILSLYYSTIEGNLRKFHHYQNLLLEIKASHDQELEVEQIYSAIIVNVTGKRWNDPALVKRAKEYADQLVQKDYKGKKTYKFYFLYYSILGAAKELDNDYRGLEAICDIALKKIESIKHVRVGTYLFYFTFKKLASCIYYRDSQKAEELVRECLELVSPGIRNWFITLEYAARNAFYSGEYDKAFDWIQTAIKNPDFKKQAANVQESWTIFQAAIYFLFLIGKLERPIKEVTRRFRLSRFLNEVPNYSKDKRGLNISIHIFQIIILLAEKKYADIIDRSEALKTYSSRYVQKNENYRSSFFFKMILQIVPGNFNRVATERKAEKFLKKLKDQPIEMSNQSLEAEIIPYEDLWGQVLDLLD